MSIPTQNEMFYIVLRLVKNLPEFTRRQVKHLVCDELHLTEEDQNEKTEGGALVYESRASWAVSWLSDANYVEKIRRAKYKITSRGKEVLNLNLSVQDFTFLLRKDRLELASSEAENIPTSREDDSSEQTKSPEEILDEAIKLLNDQLATSLMSAILKIEGREGDTFFEKLVTELIAKMGYGEGRVTSASNDAGIDGIITTDKLGFDPIMIQAKRYALDRQVGRPEVQAFAGAMGAVLRGVFFTTSTFSQPAIAFAKSYPHSTISLIDGKRLTELMIEHNVGVSEERIIHVRKIDSDYFEF